MSTPLYRERRQQQVADAKQLIADALNEGPMTTAEIDALRRSHSLDLNPWNEALRGLRGAGKIDTAQMCFIRVRRKPQAQPVFAPEALRRKRHAAFRARERDALDTFMRTGSFTRTKTELLDALDAVFEILAAKQAGKTSTHELATAAQEATGIERDNLLDVLQRLAKVGVIAEGRPSWE